MADERWFTSRRSWGEMSRPTMDRAIEAIEAGEFERAWSCARAMQHEWRFLHDLMAESLLGLVTYIQETLGDERRGRGLGREPASAAGSATPTRS